MILPNGYEMQSTFFQDFTIAECFGAPAIYDTYQRAFNEWKDDYVYLTELVVTLNWKIWEHYGKGNEGIARLYNNLWAEADAYACENLEGDEAEFFFLTTD